MRKTTNTVYLEGRIFSHELELRAVQNEQSKNYGKEYATGKLNIATDENGENVVTVHYTYEPPTFNSGKPNSKFKALSDIIDGKIKTWSQDGKEKAAMVKITSSFNVNDWYDRDGYAYSDYLTAFVFYDNDLNIIKMSDWFVFKTPMCEFTCGLAIHDDDVYITYSQLDCTSHLLVTNKETVNKFVNLHEDLNNTYSFMDYYLLAKQNEYDGHYMSSYALYNYAAMLIGDDPNLSEIKLECLIKMFCGVIKQADSFRKVAYYNEIITRLDEYIEQYPDCCELYYLQALMYKIIQYFEGVKKYKQLGDERKVNLHSYFFKYFNPNYL